MAMKLFKSKQKGGDKKAGKATADSGAAKESKKKRSGLLGEGGLGVLFANHIEKFLLVIAVVLAMMMVFSGFRKRTTIDSSKSPDDLQQQASRAVSAVDAFTWNDFRAERDRDKHFLERATETQENVLVEAYTMGQLIKPPLVPARSLRTDPKLLAARDLHVISGYGALAVKRDSNSPRDVQSSGRESGPRRQRDDSGWRQFVRGGENTRGVYFAAVTALVPYQEQLAEYKPLKNTVGYNGERDQPHYLFWFLRRAEVNGAEPLTWTYVAKSFTAIKKAEQIWDGEGDGKRLDPPARFTDELLTFKVPPLLLDDLPRYTFHPAIPREISRPAESETNAPASETNNDDGLFGGSEFQVQKRGEREDSSNRREEGSRERSRERSREGGRNDDDEFDVGDRVVNPPEFLMFRYVDMTVQPGKSYRYELRLLLDDPNDPWSGGKFRPPDADTLDQTVSERLHKKRTGQSNVRFGRFAPDSEPSPIVYVGRGDRMLVGKVAPAETVTIRDQGSFDREEPAAQVMVMTFQVTDGANIPAVKDFHRGSMANFVESVPYWPPTGDYAQSAESHSFLTNLLVLDIRGGDPMANTGMSNPGEVLVFNRDGRMEVLNELSDAAMFERSVVPVIEEKKEERPQDDEREGKGRKRGRGGNRPDARVDLFEQQSGRRGGGGR